MIDLSLASLNGLSPIYVDQGYAIPIWHSRLEDRALRVSYMPRLFKVRSQAEKFLLSQGYCPHCHHWGGDWEILLDPIMGDLMGVMQCLHCGEEETVDI